MLSGPGVYKQGLRVRASAVSSFLLTFLPAEGGTVTVSLAFLERGFAPAVYGTMRSILR